MCLGLYSQVLGLGCRRDSLPLIDPLRTKESLLQDLLQDLRDRFMLTGQFYVLWRARIAGRL